MGVIDEATTARIRSLLRHYPKGMMISDLSHQMKIDRNIMAKYLEILRMMGLGRRAYCRIMNRPDMTPG